MKLQSGSHGPPHVTSSPDSPNTWKREKRPNIKLPIFLYCVSFVSVLSLSYVWWLSRPWSSWTIVALASIYDLPVRNMTLLSGAYNVIVLPETPDPLPLQRIKQAHENATSQLIASSCPATSQVRIIMGQDKPWTLQSLDYNGEQKAVGGDEYYVYISTSGNVHPVAVALTGDLGDGTYSLEFHTTPTHPETLLFNSSILGRLTVILQYTCGLGQLSPPLKGDWATGGAINSLYQTVEFVIPPLSVVPFIPPNHDHSINLTNYDFVLAFGDSLMDQFVGGANSTKLFFHENINRALNTNQVHAFVTEIGNDLSTAPPNATVALILGSSTWDLLADDVGQGHQFLDHQRACRMLIQRVQELYPMVDLYWKSATAVHIHEVAKMEDWFHVERVFYMSSSRANDLQRYQMKIMQELGIPYLDVYLATFLSADWLRPGDGRHFQPEINQQMLSWFF